MPITLPAEATRALLADWFVYFAGESGLRLTQRGWNDGRYTLSAESGHVVTATFHDSPPYLMFSTETPEDEAIVRKTASDAEAKVTAGQFGPQVWYSVVLSESPANLFSGHGGMNALMFRLGTQVRIVGWRRLGSSILLEFTEAPQAEGTQEQSLLAPPAVVTVHIAVPAPLTGFFSDLVVHGVIEGIAAVCTFALGRPVDVPPVIMAKSLGNQKEAIERQLDPTILTLARKSVSLDVFSLLGVDGGREVSDRARAALITFDAAIRQERDTVATVLYVIAAESLTVPAGPWRDKRLVARFIDFYRREMASDLDVIINHGNFEESFRIKRGTKSPESLRKRLLEKIYSLRSLQVHEGLRPSYRGFLIGSRSGDFMQRALIHDFAEGAILSYLSAPRSSLVGHPGLDTPIEETRAAG